MIRKCSHAGCQRLVRWTSHCEQHRPAAASRPPAVPPESAPAPAPAEVPEAAEQVRVRPPLRIPRPDGFPELLVDVDADGQAVCPSCHRLLPTAVVLSHHGWPGTGVLLPMRDDDDDPPPARRAPWDPRW